MMGVGVQIAVVQFWQGLEAVGYFESDPLNPEQDSV
jgi:hypothetical protein